MFAASPITHINATMSAEDCMEHGVQYVANAKSIASDADKTSGTTTKRLIKMMATGLLVVAAVLAAVASRSASMTSPSDTTASSFSSSSSSTRQLQGKGLMVGAYYYPWHGNNFHNGDGFVRQDLEPPQLPELGKYDDTKPEVIEQHLAWSRQANVGLWVTSWWGPGTREDRTTRDVILEHSQIGDMKIALHYETTGRVRQDEEFDTKRVASDVNYMCGTYFGHDNYYRINGRPVMFVYLSRYLSTLGKIEEVVSVMRTAANKCGESLYIVGDHSFRLAPASGKMFDSFQYLDAVTNYDVYGAMGAPTTHAGPIPVDEYYDEQALWRERAAAHGCAYVSAAAPGYNDRGVRLDADHIALSRRLTETDVEGSLFEYALGRARDVVDEAADNLLMINSFNEWHEDTQIEPVAVTESETSEPAHLTNGVSYGGYGELYLDILRNSTSGHIPPRFTSSRAYQWS